MTKERNSGKFNLDFDLKTKKVLDNLKIKMNRD